MNCLGAIDWVNLLTNKSLYKMVRIFYDSLYFVVDMFINKKTKLKKFPIWSHLN